MAKSRKRSLAAKKAWRRRRRARGYWSSKRKRSYGKRRGKRSKRVRGYRASKTRLMTPKEAQEEYDRHWAIIRGMNCRKKSRNRRFRYKQRGRARRRNMTKAELRFAKSWEKKYSRKPFYGIEVGKYPKINKYGPFGSKTEAERAASQYRSFGKRARVVKLKDY